MEDIIYDYLFQYQEAYKLFRRIETLGNIYLIGGVLREYKEAGSIHDSRDIDIIVETRESRLKRLLSQYDTKRNSFGGYKVSCNGIVFDIWLLKDTWAYRENVVRCPSKQYAKKLTDTVFLNVDGIIYDWKKKKWDTKYYDYAMRENKLDVVLEKNPQMTLNLYRTLVIKKKYDMSVSERLRKCILENVQNVGDTAEKMYMIQERRYKEEVLTKDDIKLELKKILEM